MNADHSVVRVVRGLLGINSNIARPVGDIFNAGHPISRRILAGILGVTLPVIDVVQYREHLISTADTLSQSRDVRGSVSDQLVALIAKCHALEAVATNSRVPRSVGAVIATRGKLVSLLQGLREHRLTKDDSKRLIIAAGNCLNYAHYATHMRSRTAIISLYILGICVSVVGYQLGGLLFGVGMHFSGFASATFGKIVITAVIVAVMTVIYLAVHLSSQRIRVRHLRSLLARVYNDLQATGKSVERLFEDSDDRLASRV